MTLSPTVRFATIGLNHGHIYSQTEVLLRAGAELASFYAREPNLADLYGQRYPQARLAANPIEILEDESIQLIISAAIPCERAGLGIAAMLHGKDFMSDKPGFTTLEQLDEARRVQAETGRIYSILFGERLENPATVKAGELVQSGLIGQVVQTIGFGPHRIHPPDRPGWFYQKDKYGGILIDIGAHQFDQFLFFTCAASAGINDIAISAAHVANYHHPQTPGLEDFGEVLLRTNGATGYLRVDWFSPTGLNTWGDARLFLLGTEGYIEIRKNTDLGGREGGSHLFYANQTGMHYLDCSQVDLPYGRQLLADIANRTQTALPQEHVFLASELALRADHQAVRLGNLAK
jgi:predicted dehydrogenase